MKLHLPKLLCVAVMAAMALPAMGGELASTTYTGEDGQEHTKWDVGEFDGTTHPNKQYTTIDTLTLDGYDMLGTYDDNGKLRIIYGTCTGASNQSQVSPSLKVTGTLTIKDNAQLSLGGLYDGSHDDYIGLNADKLHIEAKDDANIVNFRTTGAWINDVEINSGTVLFHAAFDYNGNNGATEGTNQGNQSWFPGIMKPTESDDDTKMVVIKKSYTQSGGNVTFGCSAISPHTSGTKIYYANNLTGNISQTGGNMNVYGHTYYDGVLISQSGDGEMNFRDRIYLHKTSEVKIQQGGDNTAASDKPTMVIGKLFGSTASVILDQTNAGTMTLAYGTNFSTSGTVKVTQSGTGTVNIGGGHNMKSTDLSGFEAVNTSYKFQQTSGTINIANNATVNLTESSIGGTLHVGHAATLNVQGALNVAETATLSFGVNQENNTAAMVIDGGSSIVALGAAVSLTLTEALTTTLDNYFTSEDVEDKTMTFNLISNFDATQKDNFTELSVFTTPAAVATLATDDVAYDVKDWSLSVTDNNVLQATVTWQAVKAGEQIPEPATATLSLLALAGLAARRRRR
ncbi:MAG: hypothetical protein IJA81_02160 [Akkermansia sp.]|nr:hypothetical protein [Akkermansia sp.]